MATLNNHEFEGFWRHTGIHLFNNNFTGAEELHDYKSVLAAAKLVAQEAWENAIVSIENLKEDLRKAEIASDDAYEDGHSDGYREGYEEGYEDSENDKPSKY